VEHGVGSEYAVADREEDCQRDTIENENGGVWENHQHQENSEYAPAAGGPDQSTGVGPAIWRSKGKTPVIENAGGVANLINLDADPDNTFLALFTAPNSYHNYTLAQSNTLFGYDPNTPGNAEFGYRGPYLGPDVAIKSDPWGSPYYILGYNKTGQLARGPIWIVCAGPQRHFQRFNMVAPGGLPVDHWVLTGDSQGNIVMRVQ